MYYFLAYLFATNYNFKTMKRRRWICSARLSQRCKRGFTRFLARQCSVLRDTTAARNRGGSPGMPRALPLTCHCSATVQRFIHNLTCYPRIQLWPQGHMQSLQSPWRTIDHGDDLLLRAGTGRATDTCTIRRKIDRCSRKSHDSGLAQHSATCATERSRGFRIARASS